MADLPDDEINSWATGRPHNPTTRQGTYMAIEIQRHRKTAELLVKLIESLGDIPPPDIRSVDRNLSDPSDKLLPKRSTVLAAPAISDSTDLLIAIAKAALEWEDAKKSAMEARLAYESALSKVTP